MINLEIRNIRLDGGTQPRVGLDETTVAEYTEAVHRGDAFPDVVLFFDGNNYWLADGFHRLTAYKQAGKQRIPADVRQGTLRDAILYSVGSNATHGLRRSNDDKRRAVERLLRDHIWVDWSDREIARRCHVTHPFVAKMRQELGLTGNVTSENGQNGRKFVTKHGTEAVMSIGNDDETTVVTYDQFVKETATTLRDVLQHEFKTSDPATLAAMARAMSNSNEHCTRLREVVRQRGAFWDVPHIRTALIALAQEMQAHAPTHAAAIPQIPAISRFVTALKTLPEIDLPSVKGHIRAIRQTYPSDGYPQINNYADALEELLCALRPN